MDSFKGECKAEAGLGDGAPSSHLNDLAGGVAEAHTTVSSSRQPRHMARTLWSSRGWRPSYHGQRSFMGLTGFLSVPGNGVTQGNSLRKSEVWGHVDCYRMLL